MTKSALEPSSSNCYNNNYSLILNTSKRLFNLLLVFHFETIFRIDFNLICVFAGFSSDSELNMWNNSLDDQDHGLTPHASAGSSSSLFSPTCTVIKRPVEQPFVGSEGDKNERNKPVMRLISKGPEDLPPVDPAPAPQVLNRLSYPDGSFIERDASDETLLVT